MKIFARITIFIATITCTTTTVIAFSPPSPNAAVVPQRIPASPPTSETALSFITEKDALGTSSITTTTTTMEPPLVESIPVVRTTTPTATTTTTTTPTITPIRKRTPPQIEVITSFSQLQMFLQEPDDRPVAIKFYAPWCKTCQRLGMHFDRLAMELGDSIVDRKRVDGSIRFAAIEYGSETARLVTETLRIPGVPTLQVYKGTHKVWEEHGAKSTKGLKTALTNLQSMSVEQLEAHAEAVDDHILINAIDESFFDSPDFLNEEW